MPHLSSRVVLDARHYSRHGVKVAELARLYGVRRDTLSRAIHGHTHAELTEPNGYRPSPLPKRAPESPRRRHVPLGPISPEDRQRLVAMVTGKKPKPAPLSASERALAQVKANPPEPGAWERLREEQRQDDARRREAARQREQRQPPRRHIPSDW